MLNVIPQYSRYLDDKNFTVINKIYTYAVISGGNIKLLCGCRISTAAG